MKQYRIALYSGGATRVSGLLGMAAGLEKSGHAYDIIAGSSAGALTAACLATGRLEQGKELALSLKKKQLFKQGPLGLGAAWRLIRGKPSLGDMSGLDELIRKAIPKESFLAYRRQTELPDCYAVVVCLDKAEVVPLRLRSYDYEEMVSILRASCSIPVLCEPVQLRGSYYVDGGLMDHIPSESLFTILETKGILMEQIQSIDCCYARNEYWQHKDVEKDLLSITERSLDIMQWNTTRNDAYQIEDFCMDAGALHRDFYLNPPRLPLFDTSRMKELYELGEKAVQQ
jgi:predicted acylesterase/phospholipase RssA